jgi:hypothetical protein
MPRQRRREPVHEEIRNPLTLAGAMLSSVAHAQATIHMSRATCTEYLAMPPAQSADFSARMSGW